MCTVGFDEFRQVFFAKVGVADGYIPRRIRGYDLHSGGWRCRFAHDCFYTLDFIITLGVAAV